MHDFTGQKMPRVPSWNATQTGTVPSAIADMVSFNASTAASGSACCADEWLSERQDFGWRNRSAACVDLDDLIGTVRQPSDLNSLSDLIADYWRLNLGTGPRWAGSFAAGQDSLHDLQQRKCHSTEKMGQFDSIV